MLNLTELLRSAQGKLPGILVSMVKNLRRKEASWRDEEEAIIAYLEGVLQKHVSAVEILWTFADQAK